MNILPNIPGIYKLTNKINNQFYIGKSINIRKRIQYYSCKHNSQNRSYILRAISKYGWNNFKTSILESFDNINNNLLLEREAYWIKKLNATNPKIGYNLLQWSNDVTGIKRSKETKKKMSESRKKWFENHVSPSLGKKINAHFLKQRSLIRKGKPLHKNALLAATKYHYARAKSVKQIDKNTGKLIKIWTSIKEASLALKGIKNYQGIYQTCNKYIMKNGVQVKTALGFKWEYA